MLEGGGAGNSLPPHQGEAYKAGEKEGAEPNSEPRVKSIQATHFFQTLVKTRQTILSEIQPGRS